MRWVWVSWNAQLNKMLYSFFNKPYLTITLSEKLSFLISRWICIKCWIRINCSVLKFRAARLNVWFCSAHEIHWQEWASNNSNTKFRWKFLISNKTHDAQIATTRSTNRRRGVVAENTSEKVNGASTCYTCSTLCLLSDSKHTSNITWWCRRFYRWYIL